MQSPPITRGTSESNSNDSAQGTALDVSWVVICSNIYGRGLGRMSQARGPVHTFWKWECPSTTPLIVACTLDCNSQSCITRVSCPNHKTCSMTMFLAFQLVWLLNSMRLEDDREKLFLPHFLLLTLFSHSYWPIVLSLSLTISTLDCSGFRVYHFETYWNNKNSPCYYFCLVTAAGAFTPPTVW